MNLDTMSYEDLRDLIREKGMARVQADREARAEILLIQAALDGKSRERAAGMYAAAIGPEAVSAIIEAETAKATSGANPPSTKKGV